MKWCIPGILFVKSAYRFSSRERIANLWMFGGIEERPLTGYRESVKVPPVQATQE